MEWIVGAALIGYLLSETDKEPVVKKKPKVTKGKEPEEVSDEETEVVPEAPTDESKETT